MTRKQPKPIDIPGLNKGKGQSFYGEPVSTGSMYFINSEGLSQCVGKGKAGDLESAIKVLNYYAFSDFDREKQVYWMEKSAVLGDNSSQLNYAMYLKDEG